MHCHNCNSILPQAANFCAVCGQKVATTTAAAEQPAETECIHCGKSIEADASFCSCCGKKQVKQYRQSFWRDGANEDDFIEKLNEWFASYPAVSNVKCTFELRSGIGIMVNKSVLEAVHIEYELLNGINLYQYAIVQLSHFGLYKKRSSSILEDWKANNPGAIVIATDGATHQRGQTSSLMLGGIGATNKTQLYVMFKFNRHKAPTAFD